MVSTSFQIDVRGETEWLHTRNDFVRQSRTDAAGPGVGSKDDLRSLQDPSGGSQQRASRIISIDASHRCVGLQIHSISLYELGGQLGHEFVRPE